MMKQSPAISLWEAYAFPVGAAVGVRQLSDPAIAALCVREFSALVAENAMKPMYILDRQATLLGGSNTRAAITLEAGSPIADFAAAHGMTLRFHVLVWHQQTPRWFFTQGWDDTPEAPLVEADVLAERMANYITDVMQAVNRRWPGLVSAWDVVNEAVEPEHGHPQLLRTRNSLYYQIMGEGYIRHAFQTARRNAAPGQALCYNDFNSFQPDKQQAILRFAKPLAAEGLLTGIGMQTHLTMDFPASMSEYEQALRRYADLGVEVQATEIDIRTHDNTPTGQQALADRYGALFAVFRRAVRDGIPMGHVMLWGVRDCDSWLCRPERPAYPLLFDHTGARKPAYDAALQEEKQA